MATKTVEPPPSLTPDEAAEVIRHASELSLKNQDRQLSREDLLVMAKDLGISPESLDAALAARKQRQQQRSRLRGHLAKLANHATSYVVTVGGLAILDWMTGPG